MTGKKAHIADYQEFKGSSAAFRGSNGRITDKGKIKAGWFSWIYFLKSMDETTPILKDFIRQAKNQFNHMVKTIRSDNGTEFKNNELIEFYGLKGIKRDYSNARTPQQNGVTERKNMILIEAARTIIQSSRDKIQETSDCKTCEKLVCQVEQIFQEELEKLKRQEKEANDTAKKEATHEIQNANTNNTNLLNFISTPISIAENQSVSHPIIIPLKLRLTSAASIGETTRDDPHDDAPPKGENSVKRQKISKHGTYAFRELSSGQVNESKLDDDELPTEKVSQELVEKMSKLVDKTRLRKVVDEMFRQRTATRDIMLMITGTRDTEFTFEI
nr:ribonuclease H-like domain-containing protein [Tanacetum cinerariifolium]